VNVPGGRILDLPGGKIQVVDRGPRDGSPIVLVHCFTCAIDWWDGMRPRLERRHRVIAVDLLGHGGSEKPDGGYSIEDQANLVAEALTRLGVRNAEVVGHSLGGPVSVALAERSPRLVDRLVLIDSIPDTSYGDVGFIGELPFKPVIGQLLWRVKPDFSIRDGLEVAFAPGFAVPDAFVEDVKRMTYSSYSGSHSAFEDYTAAQPLPERASAIGKPLLAIMGAEEQIANDPGAALAAYRDGDPGAQTELIAGAGHSPNVEKPAETARMVLEFGQD
jgi:pimeloyl-ACP methyl ester carboxylesterase